MQFSLGHVLELLDKILNPIVALQIPSVLHYFTTSKFVLLRRSDHKFLPFRLQLPLDPVLAASLAPFLYGLLLRLNRRLSRRALNNKTKATFNWDKEIVVVTGGSGGIGATIVQQLASRGTKVIVLDIIPLTFKAPTSVSYYKCDITNYENVVAVAAEVRKNVGDPTVVVANAGINRNKAILAASQKDVELTFGVNNLGIIWAAKAFLPSMAANNHGHFVITASQAGYLANAYLVDYCATKSAAITIYEGLQTEMKHLYKAPAVRISCISPGAVDTQMFKGIEAPSNFFYPRLLPKDVGNAVCQILWSGEAQNVMIPAAAYASYAFKLFPAWMRVGIQDGGKDIMAHVTPHDPGTSKQ
jgi:NAD(P)-dependent dehydrogenase (short-subunit alcohol dehydrogenase family)